MGCKTILNHFFWLIEIFVCYYHEEQFKVDNAKNFWDEPTYEVMENPFFIIDFCTKVPWVHWVHWRMNIVFLHSPSWRVNYKTNYTSTTNHFGCSTKSFSPFKIFLLEQQFRVGKILELDMEFEGCPSFTYFSIVSWIMIPWAWIFFFATWFNIGMFGKLKDWCLVYML